MIYEYGFDLQESGPEHVDHKNHSQFSLDAKKKG